MQFRSTMVIFSESMASYSGVIRLTSPTKLLPPTQNQQYNVGKFNKFNAAKLTSKRISSGRMQNSSTYGFGTIHALPAGRDFHHPKFDNDLPQEPFLLTLVKEIMWAMTSLFYFLIEQPSQLKYIEWPGFNTTLKTATLTLVLVMLLIIALSSVDSALSFLLAFFSRRTS